jgi:hypothetical protein
VTTPKRPLYFRLLRVRHLTMRPWLAFLLFEGSIVLATLLALAEIVSWWGVVVIPVAVAAMVKINDVITGAMLEPVADQQLRVPGMVPARARGSSPVLGPSRMTAPIGEDDAIADPAARPEPDVVWGVAQARAAVPAPPRRPPSPWRRDAEVPAPDQPPLEPADPGLPDLTTSPLARPADEQRRRRGNQGRFA